MATSQSCFVPTLASCLTNTTSAPALCKQVVSSGCDLQRASARFCLGAGAHRSFSACPQAHIMPASHHCSPATIPTGDLLMGGAHIMPKQGHMLGPAGIAYQTNPLVLLPLCTLLPPTQVYISRIYCRMGNKVSKLIIVPFRAARWQCSICSKYGSFVPPEMAGLG